MQKELKDQLAAVFEQRIEPVQVTLFYKAGLLLVAGLMLLLPFVYLCMVGATGYAVFYHATVHLSLFETLPGRAALIAYVAPLLAGAVLLFYMSKPLFPTWGRRRKPLYTVTETNHPDFCLFVEQICQTVGAPFPKRIDLTMEVNASASFRNGIFSFFGGDLVLRIGLPLLSSLTIQQLSGVLAHELGHFSQGAGMRLFYLINRINFWFVEAVYGGRSLDDNLAGAAEKTGGSVAILILITQLFILVTRGILYLFMMLGYLLSNFLSRQMEYDADLYQIRVAGSNSFESTMYSIVLLDIAFSQATTISMLTKSYFVLSDDLAGLVKYQGKLILKDNKEEVINATLVPNTRLFDTHPSARDRIARAKRSPEKGICKIKESCSLLFHDFAGLGKQLTSTFYQQALGPKAGQLKLLPPEQYIQHFNENIDRYHPQTRRVAI